MSSFMWLSASLLYVLHVATCTAYCSLCKISCGRWRRHIACWVTINLFIQRFCVSFLMFQVFVEDVKINLACGKIAFMQCGHFSLFISEPCCLWGPFGLQDRVLLIQYEHAMFIQALTRRLHTNHPESCKLWVMEKISKHSPVRKVFILKLWASLTGVCPE